MACFIIAALTADGFIGRNASDPATWTSKADKKRFVELTKRAGAIVMGHNTWKTIGRPLKDRLTVVYASSPALVQTPGVEFTSKEPGALLAELRMRGYESVAICGGSHIYTMFMKAKLIDRLYLTIEPAAFGSGVPLFKEELPFKLTLEKHGASPEGAVFLDYAVNR